MQSTYASDASRAVATRTRRGRARGHPAGEQGYFAALRAFVDTLYEPFLHKTDKSIFVDKSPSVTRRCNLVARVFPRARFVLLVRDPLAVARSQFDMFVWPNMSPADAAATTAWVLEGLVASYAAMAALSNDPEVSTYVLRFEDVLAAPEKAILGVCNYLGVSFEEGMLQREKYVSQYGRGFGDPKSAASRQRVQSKALGKGGGEAPPEERHPQLFPFLRSVGASLDPASLRTLGYDVDDVRGRLRQFLSPRTE